MILNTWTRERLKRAGNSVNAQLPGANGRQRIAGRTAAFVVKTREGGFAPRWDALAAERNSLAIIARNYGSRFAPFVGSIQRSYYQ